MKRSIAITLTVLSLCLTNSYAFLGYEIEFPPMPLFEENHYLQLINTDIQNTQKHPNCIENNPMTESPATALIVGAGTIGVEAIVTATRLLPEQSTIVVIQNDIDDQKKLLQALKESIKRGDRYQWIVSERIEIGQLDKLEEFIAKQQEVLKNTQLYFHTADRAERFVPDALPCKAVLAQVTRRSSIAHINNLLEQMVSKEKCIIKIVTSSECAQNREEYRIPNLGPLLKIYTNLLMTV